MTTHPADTNDEQLLLQAGPLSMVFDRRTAFLRRIRVEDREVVRGIYAAVRDYEWNTIPIDVAVVEQDVGSRSFRLAFDVVAARDPVDFRWRASITGDAEGRVRYELQGRAHSSFLRNRIGFCVLHPVDGFAGRTCTVVHPDGSTEDVRIPDSVAPDQPVFDIRALTHEVDARRRIEVRFEGNVFEMEDQRNWTDASFKTYCTPLERPMPVRIETGDTVEQSVTIRLLGDAPGRSTPGVYASRGRVLLRVEDRASGTAPEIGTYFAGVASAAGAASGAAAGTPDAAAKAPKAARANASFPADHVGRRPVGTYPPAHLRVDVDAADPALDETLGGAAAAARTLSTTLFVAARIHTGEDAARLARAASEIDVSRWLLLRSDGLATSEEGVRVMRSLSDARIGGGTNAYFTELNRMRPPADLLDFVCFSVNPQVHAFDDLSMVETLPMHAALVECARKFSGGSSIVVSPITLCPRYNPDADGAGAPGTGYDPRQDAPFGAAWTAGSFIYLSRASAEAASYFDVGTLDKPLAGLLQRLMPLGGQPVCRVHSSDAGRVIALATTTSPRSFLIVNVTPREEEASVEGVALGNAEPQEQDAAEPPAEADATTSSVLLPPYGWAFIKEAS